MLAALALLPAARAEQALPDPVQLEAYVDGVVEAYRRSEGIAGVTVAVVGRDGVLLEKGYGFAALEPRRAVDPAKTLFRIASISKTFTYIMAMQLKAEGKLDLNAPADTYLPDALKFTGDGFSPPRVIELMQHTAGFEDSALGHLFMRDASPPLEDYLVRYRPKRVRPPGAAAVYSNYSVALLGLIIARLDGHSFEDSVEARILKPLGLSGVSFREPADDPALGTVTSRGFKRQAGWYQPQGAIHIAHIAPAAAASASAEGMGRYMRMLLNGGALDGVTILNPASFAEMTSASFRNAPESGALMHGFFSRRYGALQSLEHDGSALAFQSNMVLWPEAGLGVFVAVNTQTGSSLTAALPRLILEHFVPAGRPDEVRGTGITEAGAADLTGAYAAERRNRSSFEGFLYRLDDATTVTVRRDDTVVISTGDSTARYAFESENVLRALESNGRVKILRSPDGAVIGYFPSGGAAMALKLDLIDTPMVLTLVLGALLAASLFSLAATVARIRYRGGVGQGIGERAAAIVQTITALLWLGTPALLAVAALPMTTPEVAIYDYPGTLIPWARIALHAAGAASLLLVVMLVPAWTGHSWHIRRLTFTAYAVLAVAMTALLWRWGALLTPLTIAG
ncbi:Putative D-alanyl-D-alanine carboxypeptidase [Alphaproteobacteria bacterium SO-S41]|nr:Putative D-alanyl-D-alanine carboxypeptidase [Alphaproteobacteria bacterium SO-S41]